MRSSSSDLTEPRQARLRTADDQVRTRPAQPRRLLLAIAGASFSGAVTFRASSVTPRPSPASRRCGGAASAPTGVGVSRPSLEFPGQPNVYYFGATGGGVWKTDDAGVSWLPVSDGYFKTGPSGASGWPPRRRTSFTPVWVRPASGALSKGDGVYKSTDAGRSWTSSA